jgi:NAD(P)-dependent dehydrogenase (short-subunit alcohol dehydrogenase family)
MKVAWVTGAASGFGYYTVLALLAEGWQVIATLKDLAQESPAFAETQAQYPESLTLQALDLTQLEQLPPILELLQSRYQGQLDLLVNNAGFGTYGAIQDLSEAQIRQQFEVNFFGPLLLTQQLIPYLQKSGGRVISVTSIMARYAMPLVSMYSASKYALEGLSEGLRQELKYLGIQLCTVQPGGYRTPFYKSLVWGERSFDDNSRYKQMGEHFQGFMQKLAARPKPQRPQEVAQVILKLSRLPRLPRSVVVGKDAKLIALLERFLPYSLFRVFMNRLNRVILGE